MKIIQFHSNFFVLIFPRFRGGISIFESFFEQKNNKFEHYCILHFNISRKLEIDTRIVFSDKI